MGSSLALKGRYSTARHSGAACLSADRRQPRSAALGCNSVRDFGPERAQQNGGNASVLSLFRPFRASGTALPRAPGRCRWAGELPAPGGRHRRCETRQPRLKAWVGFSTQGCAAGLTCCGPFGARKPGRFAVSPLENLRQQNLPHCLHTPSPTLHHPRTGVRAISLPIM